jgi:outer membrane protein TolC
MKTRGRVGVIPSQARNLLFLFLLLSHFAIAQRPPEPDPELTLSEFRALLPAAERNPEAAARADAVFLDLLSAQGRVAAARQSHDRLAGWTTAAQARLDARSAPLLDVEMLRFAEAKSEARLEQSEDERHSALSKANHLLGRDPRAALVALTTETHPPGAEIAPQSADKSSTSIAHLQQLLPQAQELLAKIYQNYLFGGVALTALLWQEEQVYQTELQYRLLLVEVERRRAAGD